MKQSPINMFGGSPLNRLSWLRSSHTFLNAILASPQSRWVLFKSGNPLVTRKADSPKLAYLSTNDVRPFLGPEPYFGQAKDLASGILGQEQQTHFTEGLRHRGSPIVFLGLHESSSSTSSALPSSDFADPIKAVSQLEGTPYFAIDIDDLELGESEVNEVLNESETSKNGATPTWLDARSVMTGLSEFDGAIYAEARSMCDWNSRNKFCAGCGSRQFSLWGGWKFGCSSLLPWADKTDRKPCPSGKGLHNYTHPRSDSVVIMCAVDQSGDKILLGRNARRVLPVKFFSALAGFIEPGETFEDAVKREMWEEAGVKVWDIQYHSSQPWPYPANLMVGFYARADSTQPVRLDLDNELAEANWYTREEIHEVLKHTTGTTLDLDKLMKLSPEAQGEPPFRVPPITAIAGVLIRDWAEKKVTFPPFDLQTIKGNL